MNEDCKDLAEIKCHIDTTLFSHTLDPYPCVNFLGPKF